MKKVFFAAIAVCGFVFANAQVAAVNSNAGITVTLQDAIEVIPANNVVQFSGTYAVANDYDNGVNLGQHTWTIKSTRPGNIAATLPAQLTGGSNAINGGHLTKTEPIGTTFSAGDANQYKLNIQSNVPWGEAPAGTYTGTVTITFTQS